MSPPKTSRESERDTYVSPTEEAIPSEKNTHQTIAAARASNVIERINHAREIIAEQPFVKSGSVMTGGKNAKVSYSFIPISQILDAVRRAHAIAGVTVVLGRPEYDTENAEKRYSYVKRNAYGDETTWYAANGHIDCTIYGSSVDDRLEISVPFEAQDNSDKLTNKIITNAERCLYRVLYSIDEGDGSDPEAVNIPLENISLPDDPFFSPRKTAKPSADRDVAQMRDTIQKANNNKDIPACAEAIRKARSEHGFMSAWTDDVVAKVYDEIVAICREASQ